MLSLDVLALKGRDGEASERFYTSVFSAANVALGPHPYLDLHGTARVALQRTAAPDEEGTSDHDPSGFHGYVVSYVVRQPSEVVALMDAASRHGATVLKPAKKMLFGAFSGVFQAPEGTIWKLSAATRKDTGPAANPVRPTEIAVLLGVADPKVSKAFYTALGMGVDRDYGSKYIDFHPDPGLPRLGLMQLSVLAKDVGLGSNGEGPRPAVFHCSVRSRQAVDELLEKASAAGGSVRGPVEKSPEGRYGGHFADTDGFLWSVNFDPA